MNVNENNNTLDRMKQLMSYRSESFTENKPYKTIEYMTEGADGKMYGVLREGTKYYIKSAEKNRDGKPLVAENFEYIGGYLNRKDNEYTSCASALKNIELKMMSLKESCNRDFNIEEVVNPDNNAELKVKLTESMGEEISRMKQIMENSSRISRGEVITETNAFTQKPVVGKGVTGIGNVEDTPGYEDVTPDNGKDTDSKAEGKPENYSNPFGEKEDEGQYTDNNGNGIIVSEEIEGEEMPEETVVDETETIEESKIDLLKRIIKEELDLIDDEVVEDEPEEEIEYVEKIEDEPVDEFEESEDEEPIELSDEELDELIQMNDELGEKLEDIQDGFMDDDLYDDEEVEDEFEIVPEEEEFEEETFEESKKRNGRKVNEDKLNVWGKHPRYGMQAFTTPSNKHQEFDWTRKWDDESVENDKQYGLEIGDGYPFEEIIGDAVTEAINKYLKKKI